MSALGDKLRLLATEADGGTALAVPLRVIAEDVGQAPPIADRKFTEDFWVKGRMGAAKGAWAGHYAQVWQILSMMGGGRFLDSTVLLPGPEFANANELLTSTADAGWIDGSGYYYNDGMDEKANEMVYIAFGRPTQTSHGVFDTYGKPLSPSGWEAWRASKLSQNAARK